MARENKRNRDAKRFGKAERLADQFFTTPFAAMAGYVASDGEEEYDSAARTGVATAITEKVIDASNVAEYTDSINKAAGGRKTGLAWDKNILNATPPFERCFVEMQLPAGISPQIGRIGWAIRRFDWDMAPQMAYDFLLQYPSPNISLNCKWIVGGTMAMLLKVDQRSNQVGIVCPVMRSVLFLGDSGESLMPPVVSMTDGWINMGEDEWARTIGVSSLFDAMLSFCFMNCKNVTVSPVDPNPAVNRERRKAGLKPFLRYHTININPMKEVLRTEGNIEANGLNKALHICRGHFRTFGDTYFGRKLEKPMTVWCPSHVRGSAKEGVVFSDYKVKAPVNGDDGAGSAVPS